MRPLGLYVIVLAQVVPDSCKACRGVHDVGLLGVLAQVGYQLETFGQLGISLLQQLCLSSSLSNTTVLIICMLSIQLLLLWINQADPGYSVAICGVDLGLPRIVEAVDEV